MTQMFLSKPRAWALYWLCVVLATAPVIAAAVPPQVAGPATWPDRGPYEKVGDPNFGLGEIKMPRPVADAMRRVVQDDPSRWGLFSFPDFAGHGWRIIQVYPKNGNYTTLLVARGTWTILSVPESLPVLNEAIRPLAAADLHVGQKLKDYLEDIVMLQRNGKFRMLDAQFGRAPRYSLWLRGTETRRQALRDLCYGPLIKRTGDRVTVQVNVVTSRGAVDHWTFHLRVGESVRLEGTEVRQLRKKDTFFYALV